MEEPRKLQSQAISLDNHVDDNLDKLEKFQKFKKFWEIIDDPKYEKSDLRSIKELKDFIDNINLQDEFDRTLLHYAVLRKDDRSIIFLLEKGAYLFETKGQFDKRTPLMDIFNRTPLMDMPKSTYKKYLDNMISFEYNTATKEKKLIIDFEKLFEKRETLGPEKRETNYFFPTEWIYRIKKEKHLQELIQHPVIQLLIFFKWMNCQATNAVNVFFNILFFSVYLLFIIFIESRNSLFGSESCGNVTIAKYVLCGLMWASIAYFAFFDIFKIIKFFTKFKKNIMGNLLLLLRWTAFLLAIAVTVCTDKCTFEFFCNEVEAIRGISVLITTFSLYFAFIQTPRFAFYGKIFLHTFLQVLMFFVVHFILIVGYAMSFFILIYSSNGDLLIPFDARINGSDSDPKVNITVGEDTEFDNPGLAIFKSFVMFASEFDASSIPFDRNEHHVATRIVFISYIFVVTVVLFNILIGVTFSEVNKVGKNKALYDSLAFIDVIINFEENRYFYETLYFFFPNCKLEKEFNPNVKVEITGTDISKIRLKFDFGGRVVVFKDTEDCGNKFWYIVNKVFLQGKIIVPIVKAANEIVAERYKL